MTSAPRLRGAGFAGPVGERLRRISSAALSAADPRAAVVRAIPAAGLRGRMPGTVVVLSLGKAAVPMAQALFDALGPAVREGLVITKGPAYACGAATVLTGDHPLPGPRSAGAARAVVSLLERCHADDVVVLALSGGASSLASMPIDGLAIEALAETSDALMRAGVDIHGLNTVRAHLDALKGGGIAQRAHPASVVTFVLCDVVGGDTPWALVGSGPTAGTTATWDDALSVVDGVSGVATAAVERLRLGAAGGLPSPLRPNAPVCAAATHHVVADNQRAVDAALHCARQLGYDTETDGPFSGEARVVGRRIGARVAAWPTTRPRCIVLGGETTVTVAGDGVGGRNQELALGAALALAERPHVRLAALATDGEDGPTSAAGAIVDGHTAAAARTAGMPIDAALARNDGYSVLSTLDRLVHTGATGTNVCDVVVGVVDDRTS